MAQALNVNSSLVDYLKSKGMDSSPEARAKLASDYGISNYNRSAEQNTQLLTLLQQGKTPSVGPSASSTTTPSASSVTTGATGTNLTGTLPNNTAAPSSLASLRLALKDAMNEAGKKRLESNFNQISPIASGLPPGSMGGVVNLIRGGIQSTIEGTFNTITEAQQEEEKLNLAKKESAFNILNALSDSGAMLGMDAQALMAIEQQAGLPSGTTLAWQARLKTAQAQSDEKFALEQKLVKSQIDENLANAGKMRADSNASTTKPSPGFSSSKIEQSFREDAASVLERIISNDPSTKLESSDAIRLLRALYSPEEVSDDAIKSVLGIAAIGAEDLQGDIALEDNNELGPFGGNMLGGGFGNSTQPFANF